MEQQAGLAAVWAALADFVVMASAEERLVLLALGLFVLLVFVRGLMSLGRRAPRVPAGAPMVAMTMARVVPARPDSAAIPAAAANRRKPRARVRKPVKLDRPARRFAPIAPARTAKPLTSEGKHRFFGRMG